MFIFLLRYTTWNKVNYSTEKISTLFVGWCVEVEQVAAVDDVDVAELVVGLGGEDVAGDAAVDAHVLDAHTLGGEAAAQVAHKVLEADVEGGEVGAGVDGHVLVHQAVEPLHLRPGEHAQGARVLGRRGRACPFQCIRRK